MTADIHSIADGVAYFRGVADHYHMLDGLAGGLPAARPHLRRMIGAADLMAKAAEDVRCGRRDGDDVLEELDRLKCEFLSALADADRAVPRPTLTGRLRGWLVRWLVRWLGL